MHCRAATGVSRRHERRDEGAWPRHREREARHTLNDGADATGRENTFALLRRALPAIPKRRGLRPFNLQG